MKNNNKLIKALPVILILVFTDSLFGTDLNTPGVVVDKFYNSQSSSPAATPMNERSSGTVTVYEHTPESYALSVRLANGNITTVACNIATYTSKNIGDNAYVHRTVGCFSGYGWSKPEVR